MGSNNNLQKPEEPQLVPNSVRRLLNFLPHNGSDTPVICYLEEKRAKLPRNSSLI